MRTIVIIIFISFISCNFSSPQKSGSQIPDHHLWNELLKKHVDSSGMVDYPGFIKDRQQLLDYLNELTANPPDQKVWPEKDQLAYWINLYNAFTVELILRHYPLESIKDIGSSIQIPFVNSPWDVKLIEIDGKKYDLNNIEHSILRKKFDEPRIHFAINCASFSCPILRREAYVSEKLEEQLEEQAAAFINDSQKNVISKNKIQLSRIFKWYGGDFTNEVDLITYINQYSKIKIESETNISYMEYYWSLNESKNNIRD